MRFVSSFVLAFVVGLAMASNKAEASFVTFESANWYIWNTACAGQPEEDWRDCSFRDFWGWDNVGTTAEKDGAYAGYSASGTVSQTSATADLVTLSAEFSDYAYSFTNDDSVFAYARGEPDYFFLDFTISEEVYVFVEQDLIQTLFSGLLPPGTHALDFNPNRGSSSLSGPAGFFGVPPYSFGYASVGYASSSSSTVLNFSFARVYAVPEPHTAMMLGLGLVTLALARRRRAMRILS